MSDAPRTITGVFRTPEGVVVANRTLTWYRAPRKTRAQGQSVIVDELFRTSTDAAGQINVAVVPGNYLVMARLTDADRYFEVGVPEGIGALDISDLVDMSVAPVTPGEVLEARGYRDEARAWARNPEDQEVSDGEYSAFHWAKKSQAEVSHAEEWAQSPDPISPAAGGDGATDRSAKWWAEQSEAIALPDGSIAGAKLTDDGVSEPKLARELSARVGAMFKSAQELLVDASLGYSIVSPGDIIEAEGFRYEVAPAIASDEHISTAGGVKLYVLPVDGCLYLDAFGIVPDSEAAADDNKVLFERVRAAVGSSRGCANVSVATSGVYWLPTETRISEPGMRFYGWGAVLKQKGGSHTTNWLIVTESDDFELAGFDIDGNRAGASSLHPDSSLLLIFNIDGVLIRDVKLSGSSGKGASAASGVAGKGTRNVRFVRCEGWDCKTQVFVSDRSNIVGDDSIPCEDIVFDSIIVRDTDHAGIAVNDGSRRVKVLNCNLDVNNSTWDALSIRGARDVIVQGNAGRRGRNGCQISVLNAAAIARGEEARNIILSGNIWEFNQQNGCAVSGAIDVSVNGDISRNNGQGLSPAFGFIVVQIAGVRRSSNVTLTGMHAYDDQAVPSQHTGIAALAADNVRIVAPVIHGNTTRNKVHYDGSVTGLEVIGDGPDGATSKKVSGSTGSVPGNGGAVNVTLNFDTPFAETPNWADVAVFVGTSGASLRVESINLLTILSVRVRVWNTAATAQEATLHASASYLS